MNQGEPDDQNLGSGQSGTSSPSGRSGPFRAVAERQRLLSILWRGLTKRCPACGHRPIFARWNELERCCGGCGRDFDHAGGDIWGFMYLGTAFFTGLFIFVIYRIYVPETVAGRLAMAGVAIVPMIASLPRRKALALALDYLIRSHSG